MISSFGFQIGHSFRLVAVLVLLFSISWDMPLCAEQYLSNQEALKLCFPSATRFETEIVRFTPEQVKRIERKANVKARNVGNRIYKVFEDSKFLGVMFIDYVLGKHELIDYAVAVTTEGKCRQIEILEYRESHGYEVRRENWREQFKDKDAESALRLHEDIYNISGATISCRNITEGVRRVLATYEVVVRPRLLDDGILPKS